MKVGRWIAVAGFSVVGAFQVMDGRSAEPAKPPAAAPAKKVAYDPALLTPDALTKMAQGKDGGKVWGKAFDKREVSLREAGLQDLRQMLAKDRLYRFYQEHALPLEVRGSPELAKKYDKVPGYVVGAAVWLAPTMLFLGTETQDKEEAARAIKTARNAADTVANFSFPAEWAYAFFPSMFREERTLNIWREYLSGEKPFEAYRQQLHSNQEMRFVPIWDSLVLDPGMMYLDMYDVTKDEKYLEAAKRLAKTYAKTQRPDGAWPYFFNPKTGQPVANNDWPPAITILFLDRLASQHGIRDYQPVAERAFQWVWEQEIVPFDMRAHYWDVPPRARGSQGALAASEIALCLLNRAGKDPRYVAKAVQILDWVEQKFVSWDQGGKVSEQTGYMVKVRFAGGGVAEALVRAYETTGNPVYLAKGLAIFGVVMGPNIPGDAWDWYGCRTTTSFMRVYQFLKRNHLPGGE